MKKTITLVLALMLALGLLSGCGTSKDVDTSADALRVVSASQVLAPKQNWLYTYKDGLSADGARLTVAEMIAATEGTEVLTCPFSLAPGASAVDSGIYSVYDLEGNEIYHHKMVFSEPQEDGVYLCEVEISFGTEKVYSGYQLFFRFRLGEAASGETAE